MKFKCAGRGSRYTVLKALVEPVMKIAYHGDWPATFWGALTSGLEPNVIRHSMYIDSASGSQSVCRIAFVSDLHVGPTTSELLLTRTFEMIQNEKPDVLLLGGDYVFLDATPVRLNLLSKLISSVLCPVKLAVMGNHDLWADDTAIVKILSDEGVTVLVNDVVKLPHPWSDIAVIGLDDPYAGKCDPDAVITDSNETLFRIILCHSPEALLQLPDFKFDIFLAGHTHGGQVASPWGPIIVPYGRLCRRYQAGFKTSNSRSVYVSRGIGAVELPLRIFAKPDFLLLELHRS